MYRDPEPAIRRLAETERCAPTLRIVRPWSEILGAWQARRAGVRPVPRLPVPYPPSAARDLAVVAIAMAFAAIAMLASVARMSPSAMPAPSGCAPAAPARSHVIVPAPSAPAAAVHADADAVDAPPEPLPSSAG